MTSWLRRGPTCGVIRPAGCHGGIDREVNQGSWRFLIASCLWLRIEEQSMASLGGLAATSSIWMGNPLKFLQLQPLQSSRFCRGCVVAASLQPSIAASAATSIVGAALVELHRTILHTDSSLQWCAFAGPAALWFVLAAPGSISGVCDFLTSPIHALRHREISAKEVEVGRRIGEGSFGIVYEGYIVRERNERLHVVLKKAKSQVSNSSEMHSTEVRMNQYLQRNAPQAVADFLGTVRVKRSEAKGRLTEGLWLVWNFQGYHTLDHYMKQKSYPENIAKLFVGNSALSKWNRLKLQQQDGVVLRTIMNQILLNLHHLHKTGVIHRDVKPRNLILAEDSETFKLVDLGACVNLRSGYNYIPNETIMDPVYAPPEQYVMPTSTPQLPPDPFCSLISPIVWLLNTPDRFDLFSAGLVMMQLSMKTLRQDTEMKRFIAELKRVGYDLKKWRQQCRYADQEFSLLDADGASGWELVTALLQPRHDKAFFVWPSILRGRPSAAAALRHRFFQGIAVPVIKTSDVLESIPKLIGEAGALIPAFVQSVNQIPELELREKLLATMRSRKFTSAVSAAVPVVALISIGISTSFMLLKSLQSSAQLSHDISRNVFESVGLSGSVSLAFFLLVKPMLEEMQFKTQKRVKKQSNSSPKRSSYAEVNSLAEAVVALDSRLDSLEALAMFSNHEQQVDRIRGLLVDSE